MKNILIYVTLVMIALVFTACGRNAMQVTASSAPTSMRLPATLAKNDDALYYNKLLNQYITNPSLISAKAIVKTETEEEQKKRDKKMKKDFFKEFEKVGLSKQQALKAYKKHKKSKGVTKTLLTLPKNAISGAITDTNGQTRMISGKAITNKDSKVVAITYLDEDEESIIKKYNELSTMFIKMLPSSQKWKLINEKTTAKIFKDSVVRMEKHYSKYNGDYRMMPDPKAYRDSIQTYRDLEKTTLETPLTRLGYGWNSNQKIGGAIINTAMPNTINVNISLIQNEEKTKFTMISVSFTNVLY